MGSNEQLNILMERQ